MCLDVCGVDERINWLIYWLIDRSIVSCWPGVEEFQGMLLLLPGRHTWSVSSMWNPAPWFPVRSYNFYGDSGEDKTVLTDSCFHNYGPNSLLHTKGISDLLSPTPQLDWSGCRSTSRVISRIFDIASNFRVTAQKSSKFEKVPKCDVLCHISSREISTTPFIEDNSFGDVSMWQDVENLGWAIPEKVDLGRRENRNTAKMAWSLRCIQQRAIL